LIALYSSSIFSILFKLFFPPLLQDFVSCFRVSLSNQFFHLVYLPTLPIQRHQRMSHTRPFRCPSPFLTYSQGVPVTAEAIKHIIEAAGVADVEAFWPGFFAKTAAGIDIKGLLSSVGSGASAGPAAAPAAAAPAAAAGKAAPAAKAKAPEPEPEEEDSAAFSLFD
jgi:ribosomal protein L12E/L44/L45/RPP1/RPP2